MTLTFVTRGYVNTGSTPLRFPHWGYLYEEGLPPQPEPTPEPPAPIASTTTTRRRKTVEDPVLRDDQELLHLIQLFITHKILR